MANVVTLFSPSCKFSHSNHHCIVVVCPLRKTVDLKTLGVMPWLQRKIDTLRNKMNQREHRRFIKTEEKAKVVASVWGEECIQFLAALAILQRKIWKNRMNSSFSFKSSWCNTSYNLNRQVQNHTFQITMWLLTIPLFALWFTMVTMSQ